MRRRYGRASRRTSEILPILRGVALALLAAFWLVVGLFLLLAPNDVFRSGRARTRRYGAVGCLIFAIFCVVALIAT
jgi:hypothetical protein